MTDDPTRIPDDPRILKLVPGTVSVTLRSVPVLGSISGDDEYTTAEIEQLAKAKQLHDNLKQLTEVRQQARSTSAMGANFLLGCCTGTLMNLRHLLPHAEVAALAGQVKAEFAELWPEINPAFIRLLDQMITHPKGSTS